jgi:type III secretion protein R
MDGMTPLVGWIIAILLVSSFVKIATALSILRYGLGLRDATMGVVVLVASAALSLLIMSNELESFGGLDLFTAKAAPKQAELEKHFGPFLEKQSDPELRQRFAELRQKFMPSKTPATGAAAASATLPSAAANVSVPFSVQVAAFLITQLREAFSIGLLFLIPFVVIDIVVTNALFCIGVTSLSPLIISLPLKLLLFYALDGWALIAEKLIRSFLG